MTTDGSKNVVEAVKAALAEIEKLWRVGDVNAVAQYYAVDAVLTGEGVPVVVRTRDQIREVARGLMAAQPDTRFEVKIGRAFGQSAAETWISVSSPGPAGEPPMSLRVLLTWVFREGIWQIASESFSSGEI